MTSLFPKEKDGYYMGFLLSPIPTQIIASEKNRLESACIFYPQGACHPHRQCFQSGCERMEMIEFFPGDKEVSFTEKWIRAAKGS